MTADSGDRAFGAPRFDVVLRGYDRRQVDEHLSRLQRVLSRMRADLEAARARTNVPPPLPSGPRPRPTPRRRPDGSLLGDQQDVVGTFTDRMQTILQAAEDEASEIRARAKADAERLTSSHTRAEEEKARATLLNLARQRDAVLADLTRVRGQLDALLSGPTARINLPSQNAATTAAARRDAGAGRPLPGTPSVDGPPASPRRPGGSAAEQTVMIAPGRPPAAGAPAPDAVPAGATPVGGASAGAVPAGAVPVEELPDDDIPVADTPVADTPVADTPVADTAPADDRTAAPADDPAAATGSAATPQDDAGPADTVKVSAASSRS